MAELVVEHIEASELPRRWAERLKAKPGETFRVRIEAEAAKDTSNTPVSGPGEEGMPAFGMWRDHLESQDVESYVRSLRTHRY